MAEFVSRGPLRRDVMTDCSLRAEAERQDLMYHGNDPVPRFSLSVLLQPGPMRRACFLFDPAMSSDARLGVSEDVYL